MACSNREQTKHTIHKINKTTMEINSYIKISTAKRKIQAREETKEPQYNTHHKTMVLI